MEEIFLVKKLVKKQEGKEERLRLPRRKEFEMFAITTQLVGAAKIKALCEDGLERVCRIPGKLRKRVWIRERDALVVRIWDFQPSKADVVWRYLPFQTSRLERKGLLIKLREAQKKFEEEL